MNCPHCKAPNPDEATTCASCSRPLVDADATIVSAPPGVPGGPPIDGDQTRVTPPAGSSLRASFAAAGRQAGLPAGLVINERYRVIGMLGRGGMGEVYRVHDQELDRDIALKIISPEIADNPAILERFKREIQLSSEVTHRNVLRVYDLGESEGIKFVTMQLVEGEDLEGLVRREGRLPLERAIEIFSEICRGLVAAHEQAVVHRDLKPQNVMLDKEGGVYLTDFGLAKSLQHTGVTQAGEVLGTPFYMSPEQVKGEPADHRSDIFSLGVILYELTTGQMPYSGNSMYEVMMQRLQRAPRPIAELNEDVPAYLVKIIERCMATDPAARYQSVGEILEDLESGSFTGSLRYAAARRRRTLGIAALVLALAAVGFGGWWLYTSGRSQAPIEAPAPRTVLIGDFVNETGEFVFDGSLEPEFRLALEGASFINAYNRGSAMRIASELRPGAQLLDEDLARLVATREGIPVITSGSVERRGSGYRLAVRAVDTASGEEITSARADASDKEQALSAVARLAADVRKALGDTTPKAEQLAAAETFSTDSLEAAHEYGVAQRDQYAGRYDEAIQRYERAIQFDPAMGRAYAGLAVTYYNLGQRDQAEQYYTTALARIDRMSDREKFRTRGGYFLMRRDPAKAIQEYRQLVDAYPADQAGLANLAMAYFFQRDMGRALLEGRKAVELSPGNVPQRNNVGLFAMYASDFDSAVTEQQAVIEMNPDFVLAYVGLALAKLGQGQVDDAAATYDMLAGMGGWAASTAALGYADLALYQGKLEAALPILEAGIAEDEAAGSDGRAAVKLAALADVRLRLGRSAEALAAADRAAGLANGENVLYPLSRVYLEAGEESKALALASKLERRLAPDAQAYAKLIRGEVELARGNATEAVRIFQQARELSDTWIGRFDLGRAYLAAGAFLEAQTELEACVKRRGEATALFLDEVPSYRAFPPVHYYLGLALEGLGSPAATESFQSFLAIRDAGFSDPMVEGARRRTAPR